MTNTCILSNQGEPIRDGLSSVSQEHTHPVDTTTSLLSRWVYQLLLASPILIPLWITLIYGSFSLAIQAYRYFLRTLRASPAKIKVE
jgi:hypothetical protein